MAYLPKFVSRPFQGAMMVGNGLWNGNFSVPRWAIGSATENDEDLKALNAKPAKVNKSVVERVKKAYRTLGIDYGKAVDDPEYVERAFRQVRGKMKAAGVDVSEDADINDIAAAYDKMSDAQKKTYADYSEASAPVVQALEKKPGVAGQTPSPTGPTNGQRQVKAAPASTPAPLAPRNPRPAAQQTVVGTTGRFGSTGLATDSRVRVNGAPLDIRNTRAQGALAETQAATLKADAVQAAEHLKDVKSAAATADVDRLHGRRVAEFQQEKNRQALRDAQDQFREQQRAALMEKRYKNRSFRDAEDWKNLGTLREGEKMLDEKTYDEKIGDLVKRAKRLRSAEGRAGLGTDDLRDMDMVFKTVGKLSTEKREDGSVKYGGNLTPAQIEALGKRIGGFESRAQASRDRTAARVAAFNSRAADAYREQYGLQGFSDEDVLAFHDRRSKQSVGKALDAIAAIGTPKDADGVRGYEEAWDVIRRNADITGALNRALPDQAAKDRFMDDIAAITGEDAAMRREDFRRSKIIDQLNRERQRPTEQEVNLGAGFKAAVPAAQAPAEDPLRAAGIRVPDKTGAAGDVTKNDVPVTVLFPRKKKEDEDTHAAQFAGTVLRPRVRR